MIAHASLPSATIDVTRHTAFDIGGGAGLKGFGLVVVLHGTTRSSGIEVLGNRTAQQVDIGGAAHHGILTISAAIGIVYDRRSLVDMDVGIVFPAVEACRTNEGALQTGIQVECLAVLIRIRFRGVFIARQAKVEHCTFIVAPFNQRLRVEHLSIVATTIDLINPGTFQEVDLCVLRPRILTESGTIYRSQIATFLVGPCRYIDIDLSVECAVGVVVTAKDCAHACILTIVVDLCLIDVTRIIGVITIGTAEDSVQFDGRTQRHVGDRTPRGTLVVASAIGGANLSSHQVDDGRSQNRLSLDDTRSNGHAQTAVGTGSKHLHGLEFCKCLRDVDQHITAVLHRVDTDTPFGTLSCTEYSLRRISSVQIGPEVDKRIIESRLGEARLIGTIVIGILREITILIVVVAIASTEDVIYASLDIFHIGRGIGDIRCFLVIRIIQFAAKILADTSEEVILILDCSTEVVTAIDVVANPWEAKHILVIIIDTATTDVSLGMS